jgi:hypothetical protein
MATIHNTPVKSSLLNTSSSSGNSSLNTTWSPKRNLSMLNSSTTTTTVILNEERINEAVEERLAALRATPKKLTFNKSPYSSPQQHYHDNNEPTFSYSVTRYNGEKSNKKKYWQDQRDRLGKMLSVTKTLTTNEDRKKAMAMMKAFDDLDYCDLASTKRTEKELSSSYKNVGKRYSSAPRTHTQPSYPKYENYKSSNDLSHVQSRFDEIKEQNGPSRMERVQEERNNRIQQFTYYRDQMYGKRN